MSNLIKQAAVVLAFCVLSQAALANTTIYNNFGPDHDGWDYNWGLGWTVAGLDNPYQYGVEQAMQFTATTGGPVSDIWVAMWMVPFSTEYDEVTIKLATVQGDGSTEPLDSDVMEEWVLTDFAGWSAWSEPHHLVSDGGSVLQEGQNYWLWATATAPGTWAGWCMNSDSALCCPHNMWDENNGWYGTYQETASAFRVDVVPEPATGFLALLLAGLLRRR